MRALDSSWAIEVAELCDPVFEAADVGFTRQVTYSDDGAPVDALLWEADPREFAARYPDSGIVEAYGEDEWAHVH